jgi:hypothetical protein
MAIVPTKACWKQIGEKDRTAIYFPCLFLSVVPIVSNMDKA